MAGGHPVLKVGLTGGIACGKSKVASFLRELGACIIDADDLAHDAINPGNDAYRDIVRRFGESVLDDRGAIDRHKLAEIVFSDERARHDLNGIVHPRVRAEMTRRMEACAREGKTRIAVYEAALLVETGFHRQLHKLIVLRCSSETQVRRLCRRGEMSPEQAAARIAAQAPLDEKLAVADYVIDTDGTLDETRRQTEWVYAALLGDHERQFGE